MPCIDPRSAADDEHARKGMVVLCLLCSFWEKEGALDKLPDYARQWWEEHKKRDARAEIELKECPECKGFGVWRRPGDMRHRIDLPACGRCLGSGKVRA